MVRIRVMDRVRVRARNVMMDSGLWIEIDKG